MMSVIEKVSAISLYDADSPKTEPFARCSVGSSRTIEGNVRLRYDEMSIVATIKG